MRISDWSSDVVSSDLIAGGAAFIGLDALIERFQSSSADAAESSGQSGRDAGGAWTIYAAVAVDLFGDGLLIGAGSSLSFELALVLALGQVAADIPEGFATIATFRDARSEEHTSELQSLMRISYA